MNILITGISKGLGLVIVENILKEGHNIFGISRTISSELQELLEANPYKIKWIKYDLIDIKNIKFSTFKEWFGEGVVINSFINNAAFAYDDLITNLDYNKVEKMYTINVFAPLLLTKLVIRNMLLHKVQGSIIHISSISVHTGYKGLAMYASTKGAIEAFSKNTAREWGSLGIRSNCIVAGFMETEMSSSLTQEKKERIYQRTSLKKAVEKESVANTVSYLISEKSLSITGQNIHVDCGTI